MQHHIATSKAMYSQLLQVRRGTLHTQLLKVCHGGPDLTRLGTASTHAGPVLDSDGYSRAKASNATAGNKWGLREGQKRAAGLVEPLYVKAVFWLKRKGPRVAGLVGWLEELLQQPGATWVFSRDLITIDT